MSGKRDVILGGALAEFERKGFHGTSIPEIASSAGVAVGTIYRYFPSKEALVNALLAEWRARFEAEVLAAPPPNSSPRAAFRLLWRRMAGFARAHPAAIRFLELHDHAAYLDDANRLAERGFANAMRYLLAWGRREGAMKSLEPALVVALLKGALGGLMRHASDAGGAPSSELVETMEDCLWNAVAARG